jgi:hypothetical protein
LIASLTDVKDFTTADYFWPFNQEQQGNTLDSRHGRTARLEDGARIQQSNEGHKVVKTTEGGKNRGWISLGDFAGSLTRF